MFFFTTVSPYIFFDEQTILLYSGKPHKSSSYSQDSVPVRFANYARRVTACIGPIRNTALPETLFRHPLRGFDDLVVYRFPFLGFRFAFPWALLRYPLWGFGIDVLISVFPWALLLHPFWGFVIDMLVSVAGIFGYEYAQGIQGFSVNFLQIYRNLQKNAETLKFPFLRNQLITRHIAENPPQHFL